MNYALLDLDSGNEIGHYESESAALSAVRRIAGSAVSDPDLALEAIDSRGRISVVAEGVTLIERAVTPPPKANAFVETPGRSARAASRVAASGIYALRGGARAAFKKSSGLARSLSSDAKPATKSAGETLLKHGEKGHKTIRSPGSSNVIHHGSDATGASGPQRKKR